MKGGHEVEEQELETRGKKIVRRDLAWIWTCYLLTVWVVGSTGIAQSRSQQRVLVGLYGGIEWSQLGAAAWLSALVLTRCMSWIVPCQGVGVGSILDAVLCLSSACFAAPLTSMRPDKLFELLCVTALNVASSWMFMVVSLKTRKSAHNNLNHLPANDAFYVACYLSWIPSRPFVPIPSQLLWILHNAYVIRSLYALFELVTCSYAISRLDVQVNIPTKEA